MSHSATRMLSCARTARFRKVPGRRLDVNIIDCCVQMEAQLIRFSRVCSYSLIKVFSCLLSCCRPWFSVIICVFIRSSSASYSSECVLLPLEFPFKKTMTVQTLSLVQVESSTERMMNRVCIRTWERIMNAHRRKTKPV